MTDITRFRGDTLPDEVLIQRADGTPVNLTGYGVLMTVNRRLNPTTIADQLYQLAGVIAAPATGIVQFTPTLMQADQPPGVYYYDIQLIDGLGTIRTAVKAKYIYTQDITK